MTYRCKQIICLLLTLMLPFAQTLQPIHSYTHAHAEEANELIRGTFQYAGMYNNQQDSVLDYAYSDAYFEGDARVYNPSLSTMSLALEMASWSSLDEENWVDKTANARELLTEIGFIGFAQNDFWNDMPTVESIGAVAAHKELEDSTLIALAVRGGGYFSEWGSNVLIGSEDEHTGFATARDNVLSLLHDYITQYGINGRVKLWIVGFSRGGAVANMTAGYLNIHGLTADASLVPADLYCYTVEASQGIQVSDAGTDSDHSNIHNIINPNDIVPLVAPDGWGFGRYNQTSHLLPTIKHRADAQMGHRTQAAALEDSVQRALAKAGQARSALLLHAEGLDDRDIRRMRLNEGTVAPSHSFPSAESFLSLSPVSRESSSPTGGSSSAASARKGEYPYSSTKAAPSRTKIIPSAGRALAMPDAMVSTSEVRRVRRSPLW